MANDDWIMGAAAAQDQYRPLGNDPWTGLMPGQKDLPLEGAPFSDPNSPVVFRTASPLVNFTKKDLENATTLALGFSGGGLATKPVKASVKIGDILRPAEPANIPGTAPEQIDTSVAPKMGEIAAPPQPGIRAYHGSPHDFDRFDLSKIGTGEGAQAYGHGLYFAGNEGVARSYRDQLAGDMFVRKSGEMFDPQALQHLNVRSTLNRTGDIDAAIKQARSIDPTSPVADMAKTDLKTLEFLKAEGGLERGKGHMYEVNINADPAHFLDWDKPLSGQSGPVTQTFEPDWSKKVLGPDATGKDLYEWIAGGRANRGSSGMSRATNDLLAQDIPGIKYLDQGSRTAGQGSSNYVVFNPDIIDILRKYGLAGAAPAGMGALAAQDQYYNP